MLLVTDDRLVCVANTMDARRLAEQELAGLGFEMVALKWYAEPVAAHAQKIAGRGRLLADMPLPRVRISTSSNSTPCTTR